MADSRRNLEAQAGRASTIKNDNEKRQRKDHCIQKYYGSISGVFWKKAEEGEFKKCVSLQGKERDACADSVNENYLKCLRYDISENWSGKSRIRM